MTVVIEHHPWIPQPYLDLPAGHRIGIVGHSHHSNEPDYDRLTIDTVDGVANHGRRLGFFTSIARYFGNHDTMRFWQDKLFFNAVPSIVGDASGRYNGATPQQQKRAPERAIEIFERFRPDLVFVFSPRAWELMPPTLQDEKSAPVIPDGWEDYHFESGHQMRIVQLRHPQGANREEMTACVSRLMVAR